PSTRTASRRAQCLVDSTACRGTFSGEEINIRSIDHCGPARDTGLIQKRSEEAEMSLRTLIVAVTLLAVGRAPFANSRSQVRPTPSEAHVMVAPEELVWQPIPPAWADGPPPTGYTLGHSEVAIVEG